jgi:hypothetical protein
MISETAELYLFGMTAHRYHSEHRYSARSPADILSQQFASIANIPAP